LTFAPFSSGVHGLASGQKPGQAKPNHLAWKWLWPGFGSQKPKPSQKAKASVSSVEYYLFTYFHRTGTSDFSWQYFEDNNINIYIIITF
jgi:hypothetical protein